MSGLPIAFVDLDDTLFATQRKQPDVPLVVVAQNAEGRDGSFMNPVQVAFWTWLQSVAHVIPTTARTTKSYSRVTLATSNNTICSAGCVILTPDGCADVDWQNLVCERVGQVPHADLQSLLTAVALRYDHSLEQMREYDQTVFYRLRSQRRDSAQLSNMHFELQRELPDGWRAHLTNHDVSILRDGCQKRDAIEWLLENRLEPAPFTIGIGDSMADIEFLSACDFAMGPQACQWLQQLAAPIRQPFVPVDVGSENQS